MLEVNLIDSELRMNFFVNYEVNLIQLIKSIMRDVFVNKMKL